MTEITEDPTRQTAPNIEKLRHHLTKWVRPGESYGVQLGADMLRGVLAEYDVLAARIAELEGVQDRLRHVVNDQAHRIAELETQRGALEAELYEALSADGSAEYGEGDES